MIYSEIYKLNNDGAQSRIAVCRLQGEGVVCEGEKDFIAVLERDGIDNYSESGPKKLYFQDGMKFLEQLKYNFKSGYLNASDILEN